MFQLILADLCRKRWSRANQAHIAFKDVQKLRQFIKAGLADKLSDARNTHVFFQFLELLPFQRGVRIVGQMLEADAPAFAEADFDFLEEPVSEASSNAIAASRKSR